MNQWMGYFLLKSKQQYKYLNMYSKIIFSYFKRSIDLMGFKSSLPFRISQINRLVLRELQNIVDIFEHWIFELQNSIAANYKCKPSISLQNSSTNNSVVQHTENCPPNFLITYIRWPLYITPFLSVVIFCPFSYNPCSLVFQQNCSQAPKRLISIYTAYK